MEERFVTKKGDLNFYKKGENVKIDMNLKTKKFEIFENGKKIGSIIKGDFSDGKNDRSNKSSGGSNRGKG